MSAPSREENVAQRQESTPMNTLNTHNNFASPDDFYEDLIEAHRDLDAAQSHELNAALVLLLANHIGDRDVLREALEKARDIAQAAS